MYLWEEILRLHFVPLRMTLRNMGLIRRNDNYDQ